jgi:alkylation response protein AidB-like acyl-CoA dehydrogenase
MIFDLSDTQSAARESARQFAREHVAPHAADIEARGRVPADLLARATALVQAAGDPLSFVLVIEALAGASASGALAAAAPAEGAPLELAGLRGAPATEPSERQALAVCAAALGVARAALDRALTDLREAAAHPGEADKPHWAVADAATELDAAQLVTYRAATLPAGEGRTTAVAMARLLATAAAARAVDVALRLAGPAGFAAHGTLDRLARDVRALALVDGGEDEQRATAAAGLLPG